MADLSAFLKTHDDISDLGDWAETENDWSKGEVVPKAATAPKSTRTKLPKASTPSFQPKFAGPPYCVRISSIPLSSSEKEISELLWPTGAINVRFHFSKSKFSGNAFANFDSLEELVKALALDKTKVNGTALKVEEAEVKRAGQGMIASRRPKATEAGPTLVGRKSDRGYKVPVPQSNKGNRKVSSGSSKTPVLPRTRISVENKATAPAVVASQPASKKETAPAKVKVDPFGGARPREVVLEKRSSEVAVTPEVAPLVTILKKSTSAQPEEKKDTVLRKKKSHKSKRKVLQVLYYLAHVN